MQPQAAVYRKKNNLLAEPALLVVTTIALFAELHIKFAYHCHLNTSFNDKLIFF